MSDTGGTDTNLTILMVVNIIVSFFGFIAAMRWKLKCGNNMMSCKPKDAPPSPGSEAVPPSPARNFKEEEMIAVVVDKPKP